MSSLRPEIDVDALTFRTHSMKLNVDEEVTKVVEKSPYVPPIPTDILKVKKSKKANLVKKSVKSVKCVKEKVLNSAISSLDKQFDELTKVLTQIHTSRVSQTDEFVLELLRDKETIVKAKLASVKVKLQGKKTALDHI